MMRAIDFFKRRSETLRAAGPALVVMPEGAPHVPAVVAGIESLGLEAGVFHNARSALAAIDRLRPPLVVHSFRLPDMDGATFHAAVQHRSGGRRIPALVIMPADRTPDQHFGRQTGIMEYLCAPFRSEELAARLRGLVPHAREGEGKDESAAEGMIAVGLEPGPPEPSSVEIDSAELGPAETASLEVPSEETASLQEPEPAIEIPADEPAVPEPDLREPAVPVSETGPAVAEPASGPEPPQNLGLGIGVIGLGEWGRRAADLFARRGIDARGVDTSQRTKRARSEALEDALPKDPADLLLIVANLAGRGGELIPLLLQRLHEMAPETGRLALVRLPGTWSGPEERARGLIALNAILQAPAAGVLLVQQEGELRASIDQGAYGFGALSRLLDIFETAAGRGAEPLLAMSRSALIQHFSVPGFIGWREVALTEEMCVPDSVAWQARLENESSVWQPEGFGWGEAQSVLPFVRAPRSWIEEGGRIHFDRLVQSAWDEAAPCIMAPALYAGERPAAVVVSAGMPFPTGVLTLRDSVEVDRPRLAAKRRAAGALIPLAEGFVPGGETAAEPAPSGVEEAGPPAAEPEADEPLETIAPERVEEIPVIEPEPASAGAPALPTEAESEEVAEPAMTSAGVDVPVEQLSPEEQHLEESVPEESVPEEWVPEEPVPEEPVPEEPVPEEPVVEEAPQEEPAIEERAIEEPAAEKPGMEEPGLEEPSAAPVEEEPAVSTSFAPASARSVYRRALALARRILGSGNPSAEIDLGGIRYVLYDLLEMVREDPSAMLDEVFRPVEEDYFERHHVNVAILVTLVGDRLHESLSSVIDLGTAAMLHDVGMSDTRETWDVDLRLPPDLFDRTIRGHPKLGFRRLQEVAGMTGDIARVVLEEHERMDGTGYPAGMAGESIDPGARVLAICDTLEALTHPRPFRSHVPPAEALSRLQILAQHTLDPEIVDATVTLLGPLLPASGHRTNGG